MVHNKRFQNFQDLWIHSTQCMTVVGFYSVVALELIQYSNNHIEGDDWILMQKKNDCNKKTNSETGFPTTCDVWIKDGSSVIRGIIILSYRDWGCRMK